MFFFQAGLPSIDDVEVETGMRFPSRPVVYLFMLVKEALAIVVALGAIYFAWGS